MLEFLDLRARYDAEILGVDRCLGDLVDGLKARGILRDTLLVVTSSHGEEFLEHACRLRSQSRPRRPRRASSMN